MVISPLDETGIKDFTMEGITVWGYIDAGEVIPGGSDETADVVGRRCLLAMV